MARVALNSEAAVPLFRGAHNPIIALVRIYAVGVRRKGGASEAAPFFSIVARAATHVLAKTAGKIQGIAVTHYF